MKHQSQLLFDPNGQCRTLNNNVSKFEVSSDLGEDGGAASYETPIQLLFNPDGQGGTLNKKVSNLEVSSNLGTVVASSSNNNSEQSKMKRAATFSACSRYKNQYKKAKKSKSKVDEN